MSRVKPILVHLSEVSGRLKSTKSLAVASDFDGTLAEIRPHPTEASIHPRARRALESLNTQPRARVAVVSGRPLRELSPKVALPGVALFGVFGQERSVDGRVVNGTAVEPAALPGDLRTALQSWCEEHPSTWIEDKGFAITVHYRQLPPRLQAAFAAGVRRRLASWRGRIRTFSGKKAFEILPMDSADKATALRGWIESEPEALMFFFGDDVHDDAAHRFVRERGGFAVSVGEALSSAEYGLRSTEELAWFLEWLEREWREIVTAAPEARELDATEPIR